jgi:hypothetical protein
VKRYMIVRFHAADGYGPVKRRHGLTLEEAREHCRDPESSSSTAKGVVAILYTAEYGTWFDGYTEDDGCDEDDGY